MKRITHHEAHPLNSLLGEENSGFRIEQGICRNALELGSEPTDALPKRGRKWPEFENSLLFSLLAGNRKALQFSR
jgi:hypothetical protein